MKAIIQTLFFSFLCISIPYACAMQFDDAYDYYDQLRLEINAPHHAIQKAFTKKIKPFFDLVPKENYPGKTIRERLVAYDNQHGILPLQHKQYDRDKKAFDVLRNLEQRKAYDKHKGYDKPEPQMPTDYHGPWCTGYCKKYIHKIHVIDKEKLIGQTMPVKCGHHVCALCAQFDPVNKYNGLDVDAFSLSICPFGIKVQNCGCLVCPYILEKHLAIDYASTCPKCRVPITNVAAMRQELMKNMSFGDFMYYSLPLELRPLANKQNFGLFVTGVLTAQWVRYFGSKARSYNLFESLERAADGAVSTLLSFEFEQFDDMNVLGLQERFDIETIFSYVTSEPLKENLTKSIIKFDETLKKVYDTICTRYYYQTVEIFMKKEAALVAEFNMSLNNLKKDITTCRVALGIQKTVISPTLKTIAGLCVGGLAGLYVWAQK